MRQRGKIPCHDPSEVSALVEDQIGEHRDEINPHETSLRQSLVSPHLAPVVLFRMGTKLPLNMRRIASALLMLVISSGILAQPVSPHLDLREGTLDHDPSNQEIAGKRNLKLYADGGNFGATAVDQGATQNITGLRDFIWSHWKEKKRGYVRLMISGTDNMVTLHIFIEPGRHGTSYVRWRGVNRWTEGSITRSIMGHWSDAVALERAQPTERDRPGGNYVLVFKAKDRKEVWRL